MIHISTFPLWSALMLLWSLCAVLWAAIAATLVWRWRHDKHPLQPLASIDAQVSLTVFKPLPGPLSTTERERLSKCLDSFVTQLDEHSEILIGCHTVDAEFWQHYRKVHRSAKITVVCHPSPQSLAANPKISWMHVLIPHARNKLWLWSDADIKAPTDVFQQLREDFAASDTRMVTCAYVIDRIETSADILDAMFVNYEFYPGVLLLGRTNGIKFGFGSGMLFAADDFAKSVDLNYLGRSLADDYQLGRLLQPVQLSRVRFSTSAQEKNWRGALSHYYRWQKTIRWNRPVGFASQLIIMPLLGWLVFAFFGNSPVFGLAGIATMLAVDVLAVIIVCRGIGCHIPGRLLPFIPVWSAARVMTWLLCWLPIPVIWRGQKWRAPFRVSQD